MVQEDVGVNIRQTGRWGYRLGTSKEKRISKMIGMLTNLEYEGLFIQTWSGVSNDSRETVLATLLFLFGFLSSPWIYSLSPEYFGRISLWIPYSFTLCSFNYRVPTLLFLGSTFFLTRSHGMF
jgi:hypothetical protein